MDGFKPSVTEGYQSFYLINKYTNNIWLQYTHTHTHAHTHTHTHTHIYIYIHTHTHTHTHMFH